MRFASSGWIGQRHEVIEEPDLHDRRSIEQIDSFFEAELARESCVTPKNCKTHRSVGRCGQNRKDVIAAIVAERKRPKTGTVEIVEVPLCSDAHQAVIDAHRERYG